MRLLKSHTHRQTHQRERYVYYIKLYKKNRSSSLIAKISFNKIEKKKKERNRGIVSASMKTVIMTFSNEIMV